MHVCYIAIYFVASQEMRIALHIAVHALRVTRAPTLLAVENASLRRDNLLLGQQSSIPLLLVLTAEAKVSIERHIVINCGAVLTKDRLAPFA